MTTAIEERICEHCDEREAPPDARQCPVCAAHDRRMEARDALADAARYRVEEDAPENVVNRVNRLALAGWAVHSLTTVSETNGDGNLCATLVAVLRNEGYDPERHRRAQEQLDECDRAFQQARRRYLCDGCLAFVFELDRLCARCEAKADAQAGAMPGEVAGAAHES